MRKISAIILAGGRSSRMGKNKAFLVIDQISMIERQIQELTRRFAPIIIVSGQPELYDALGVEVYQDEF
ncbi:MAG: nucleotidyltransferase family protein, partial [Peptococcaceae bacterium]|nr:nucleotidyltransferase family protein [Peptococcaceae bacterium]